MISFCESFVAVITTCAIHDSLEPLSLHILLKCALFVQVYTYQGQRWQHTNSYKHFIHVKLNLTK